ncbi:MAG: hypothetical protein J6P98_04220 [Clostridia bacterium]|nr:hypothetical protein [Clostridia bacterium]
MAYTPLSFDQYFINTSEDFNKTGRVSYKIDYITVNYTPGNLLAKLGLMHTADYELHYEEARDAIQINFQCTAGASDWFANIFEFSSKYYDAIDFQGEPLQLRVHHGWGEMYRAVKHEIRDGWKALHDEHPSSKTEVIGWSLGSGIAALCAQDLNYNFGLRCTLLTYGSVKPFKAARRDRKRMRAYLDTVCGQCMNFADVNDLIAYMPPFRGFMTIRTVLLGTEYKRSLFKLVRPLIYHTHYDRPDLYRGVECIATEPSGDLFA